MLNEACVARLWDLPGNHPKSAGRRPLRLSPWSFKGLGLLDLPLVALILKARLLEGIRRTVSKISTFLQPQMIHACFCKCDAWSKKRSLEAPKSTKIEFQEPQHPSKKQLKSDSASEAASEPQFVSKFCDFA